MQTEMTELEKAKTECHEAETVFRALERSGRPIDGQAYQAAHKRFLNAMNEVARLKGVLKDQS